MYYVVSWNTKEIVGSFKKRKSAIRVCRGLGHEQDGTTTHFNPVAYVAIEEDGVLYCDYNPSFLKRNACQHGKCLNCPYCHTS